MEGGHSCFGLLVLVLFKEKQKVKLSGNINEFAIPLNHFYAIIKFNLYIFFGGGRMDKISGVKLSKMRLASYSGLEAHLIKSFRKLPKLKWICNGKDKILN